MEDFKNKVQDNIFKLNKSNFLSFKLNSTYFKISIEDKI